jgi:nucleoporin SEH1
MDGHPHPTWNISSDDADLDLDLIQLRLDSVNRRLARPTFLRDLTCSRLPSQAASDSSLSPGEVPHQATLLLPQPSGVRRVPLQALDNNSCLFPAGASAFQKSPLHRAIDDCDLADLPHVPHWSIVEAILNCEFGAEPDDDDHQLHGVIHLAEFEKLDADFTRAWFAFVRNSRLGSGRHGVSTIMTERLGSSGGGTAAGGFTTFDHGHSDLVLAVDFNFYGNRMVTASSDHRLKVFDKKAANDDWVLLDSWRAHDAEVVDVKWNGPFTGSFIGSIGEDGKFILWEEDMLEPPCSSRRFKRLFTIRSETKIPFCSLDFKNVHLETYIALITRDGYLTIYEPVDHDNLAGDLTPMLQQYVCPTPSPQAETGFRVAWHREKLPCWTAIEGGLDRKSLSLAVAAMDVVKIFRTDKERKWFLAAELTGAKQVIRDVAWANGSMRGYDLLATASKDGFVRIYEVSTPQESAAVSATAAADSSPGLQAAAAGDYSPITTAQGARQPRAGNNGAQSGIGAGLAARSGQTNVGHQQGQQSLNQRSASSSAAPGRIKQTVKKVAELSAHGGSVWRVAFSQTGE